MDEKPQNIDSEALDQDVDFGDDLLDEDDWDNFDDEDDGFDAESANSAPVQQKSFLSKNFNAIVIAIAVLGAGGWFLLNMSSQPVEKQGANSLEVQDSDAAPALSDNADLPPMPVPTNAVEELENFKQERVELDEILTPMPEIFETKNNEKSQEPIKKEGADNAVAPEDFLAPEAKAPLENSPTAQESLAFNGENTLPTEDKIPPNLALTLDDAASNAESFGNEKSNENEELSPTEEVSENLTGLENRLAEIERTNAQLSQQIQSTTEAISALSAAIDNIQKSLLKLSAQPREAANAPPPKPKANETATKAKPAKSVPKPKKNVEKLEWVLRSAQPGKAIIAAKNKADLRTVKVGDKIQGLGEIQSIELEGGRWIILGTQGQVTQ